MARSYGYSNDEIDQVVNKVNATGTDAGNNVNNATNQNQNNQLPVSSAAGTVAYPPTSDVMIVMDDIPSPTTISPIMGRKAPSSDIYGHDFFISDGLALIPSINAPIPESYKLGPGDEVSIDIWGDSNANYNNIVANDGTIIIQGIGPVTVSGLTVAEAEKMLKSRLSRIYSSLRSSGSSIHLNVSKIRGVTVYVLGEVMTPGVYTLPSLTSIATAIYMAGGIMEHGSVRNINLYRGSKLAGTFDLYDYIFNGKYDANIKLQDGDIISVGGGDDIVKVGGGLNRNTLKYELKKGETISDLISFAGGFSMDAYKEMVHIDRQNAPLGKSFDINADEFDSFQLCGGDSVYVNVNIPKYTNRVYISGAVLHPGPYSISEKTSNVRQLIEAAGGLQEGTYTNRGFVCRYDEEMKPVSLSFNLDRIMKGLDNIDLVRDDSVRVFTVMELQDSIIVSIDGEVNNPGDFDYREGLTVGDIILMAGGTNDGGDLSNVEIASRGRDSLASVIHLDIINNSDASSTLLSPFDMVFVRKKTNYRELQTVTVSGEVKYPGVYAIEKNTIRLSDVIDRAEGFTQDAYVKGAKLMRLMTEDDVEKTKITKSIADSLETETMMVDIKGIKDIGETYPIAIDLAEAIKHPGSYADVILRSGDEIIIPQMNNTVKISGGVYFPNTVAFNPSFSWRDYIQQAGGFVKSARKHRTYALYMDGSSAVRGSNKFKMEPGMEIIVPQVAENESEKISFAEIASLTSSVSSMAYMAAILINLFK